MNVIFAAFSATPSDIALAVSFLYLGAQAQRLTEACSLLIVSEHQVEGWKSLHKYECADLAWWDVPGASFPESERIGTWEDEEDLELD